MENQIQRFITKITEATPEFADNAAKLMNLAFDDFSQIMFGTKKEDKILSSFQKLWVNENNRMSSRFSHVAIDNNNAVGLISSYEGYLTTKLLYPSIMQVLKVRPGLIPYMLTHLNYLYSIINTPEALEDEYYIFMLAVLPEYQNKGIGTQLIRFAEFRAKQKNFKKVSLMVRADNVSAIRFYERNGYEKVMQYNKKPLNVYKVLKEIY